MIIALVDTETTGLDADKDTIIELAVVLADFTETQGMRLIEAISVLIPHKTNAAENVNQIDPLLTEKGALTLGHALDCLEKCDVVVAHNAKFDCMFVDKLLPMNAIRKPWVCTIEDYEGYEHLGKRLTHRAADLGIFMSAGKHRALVDTMLLMEVVANLGFEAFSKALERSMMPSFKIQAIVSFDEKDKAKEHGFKWEPQCKVWTKMVRAASREDALKKCAESNMPFRTVIYDELKSRIRHQQEARDLPPWDQSLEDVARMHAFECSNF